MQLSKTAYEMQVTMFQIQDTSNIINHIGCSLYAADHHRRSAVWTHYKRIIHSAVYMFSPLLGLVYMAPCHADWPCDVTGELSLSGAQTDRGQFLRALTDFYHLYQRSRRSLTEEFPTFFGKNNVVECDCRQMQICTATKYEVFLESFNSLFHL